MKLINDVTKEKLRGGFYTPSKLAKFISEWLIEDTPDNLDILEPSCGDGAFIKALRSKSNSINSIEAIEINDEEAKKARCTQIQDLTVKNDDFLKYYLSNLKKTNKFDIVLGNPPYIRYQFLNKQQKENSRKILELNGVKHSKLMNAWVTFLIASVDLLSVGGKLGFVLPAELLQVGYASVVRDYLAKELKDILIITFKKLVFEEIQQEVLILLGTKNSIGDRKSHTINHIELHNENDLVLPDIQKKAKIGNKRILSFTDKWTYYFLNRKETDLLDKSSHIQGIEKLKKFADVEVGITTGANKFFTVTQNTVEKFKLNSFAYPLVGRSIQVRGVIYDNKEFEINKKEKRRVYLLNFDDYSNDIQSVEDYLSFGEKQNIHKGYKCSIRDKWYVVPSVWSPDAFILRRNNKYPKFVVNDIGAYSTDTMHRVKIKENVDGKALAVSFYNSISFAFAEIFGRSYGGGVLEILPSEAENIYIPYRKENRSFIKMLDNQLKENVPIDKLLDFFDEELLIKPKVADRETVDIFRSIWKKLSSRRIERGKG